MIRHVIDDSELLGVVKRPQCSRDSDTGYTGYTGLGAAIPKGSALTEAFVPCHLRMTMGRSPQVSLGDMRQCWTLEMTTG